MNLGPNFEDYVHHPKNNINNFIESYFFLKGISGKIGGRQFEVIDGKNIQLQGDTHRITFLDVIKNIVKIFSYLTVVMPVAMAIGKTYLRQKHAYTIIEKENKVSHVSKEWRKGIRLSQPLRIENSKEANQRAIEHRKDQTNQDVEELLNIIKLIDSNDPRIIYRQTTNFVENGIFDDGSEDGLQYTCTYSPEYKMKTWRINIEDEKFEINEFEKGSYHGPKTEGFITREKFLMGGARYYLEHLPIQNEERKNQIKEKLTPIFDQLEENFLHDIRKEEFKIDPQVMKNQNRELGTEHYKTVHAGAEKLLFQLARDIQFSIHEITKAADPNCAKFDMQALNQAEKEYIISKGRPTTINTYFVKDKQFFSTQRPASTIDEQGQENSRAMLPSTVRDRPGLANYVITSFGEISTQNGNITTKVLFEGIRHSSYPPIAIKDPIQRRAIAFQNCKQNLTDITASILDSNPDIQTSQERPLVVPLRTMMLLSPKRNIDFFRNHSMFIAGKWTGESETLQMEESALALKVFNQRPMKVLIEGIEVWIKPDISFMNLGANVMVLKEGGMGAFATAQSMHTYNAKGFIDFEKETFDFIGNLLQGSSNIRQGVMQLANYTEDTRLRNAEERIEKLKRDHTAKITILYSRFEKMSENYLKASEAEKKVIGEQIRAISKNIEQLENEIYDAYKNYLGLKSDIFKTKKEDIKKQFQRVRADINQNLEQASEQEKKQLILARNLLFKLEEAISIFHTQSYKQAETILDFQNIYMSINESMSNFVEFYCKSAEDRSGEADDKWQEEKIFESLKGHPPITVQDKEFIKSEISPLVHQYSSSQNNTEQNSGARGKKISPKIFSHIPAEIDKMHAKLAKSIFSKSKKLKPSPQIVELSKEAVNFFKFF